MCIIFNSLPLDIWSYIGILITTHKCIRLLSSLLECNKTWQKCIVKCIVNGPLCVFVEIPSF